MLANGVYCLVIYEGAPVMLEKVDVDISSIFLPIVLPNAMNFQIAARGEFPALVSELAKRAGPLISRRTYVRARIN